MQKKILIAMVVAVITLSGCSSSTMNANLEVKAVAHVKPVEKPGIMDNLKERKSRSVKKEIVKVALSGKNVPYVFSGASKGGWDCSGFTSYVYKQVGIDLEHSANKQGHMKHTKKPVPGDIVAFSYDKGKTYHHVGIYLGNNKVIDANRYYRTTVVESLDDFKGQTIVFIKVM